MRKNFLLILTFIVMGLGLLGTWLNSWGQGGNGPNISFLKNPWITGPSGVYTKYTDQEGNVRWSPSKSDLTVVIQSEASGFGDVTSTLKNITIAGPPYSTSQSGTEIGRMQVVYGFPFSAAATWAYSSHGKSIPFIETPGTYSWSASGEVKLTPYAWEWELLSGPHWTGSWVPKPNLAKIESAAQTSGTWRVEHKAECIACKVTANTVADLSPAHDKVLCAAPGCNALYRKCTPGNHTSTSCPISITRNGSLVYCDIPAWKCTPHTTHHFGSTPPSSGSNPPSSGSNPPSSGSNPPSGGSTPPPPPPPSNTTTCAAGHPYNPNSTWQVNRHKVRTCRYSSCGKSWQRCVSSTPICDKPYRKRNGLRCWAM